MLNYAVVGLPLNYTVVGLPLVFAVNSATFSHEFTDVPCRIISGEFAITWSSGKKRL